MANHTTDHCTGDVYWNVRVINPDGTRLSHHGVNTEAKNRIVEKHKRTDIFIQATKYERSRPKMVHSEIYNADSFSQ